MQTGAWFVFLVGLSLGLAEEGGSARQYLGYPCTYDYHCNMYLPNSECHMGFCACAEGFITQNSQCMIHTNEECPATIVPSPLCADPHASCVAEPYQYPSGWWGYQHYCRCDQGYLHDAGNDQCRPGVGTTCTLGIPCLVGECSPITGQCTCSGFYVPSTDGYSCLAGLGAICAIVDCADENAECVNSVCVCSEEYQSSTKTGDARPVCRKRLGADCDNAQNCAVDAAVCTAMALVVPTATACVCDEGLVPTLGRDDCLPVQGEMGGACEQASQCAATFGAHASCVDGACACEAGYSYSPGTVSCVR